MTSFSENLVRSIRQAQAHARGEPASGRFVSIPAEASEEETARLVEEFLTADEDNEVKTNQPATSSASSGIHIPSSRANRTTSSPRRVAASGRDR